MAPPKKGKKKGGSWFAADHGPLPGWGWAVVAGASVFLYRKIYSPSTSTATAANAGDTTDTGYASSTDLYAAGFDSGIGALTGALGSGSGIGGSSGLFTGTTGQQTPSGTSTSTTAKPAPTVTAATPNASTIAGYTELSGPTASSAYSAADIEQYGLPAGMTPNSGDLIPAIENDQWTAGGKALPKGSNLYIKS